MLLQESSTGLENLFLRKLLEGLGEITLRQEIPERTIMHEGKPVEFHIAQEWAYDSDARIVALIAGSQSGKALAIDTPIPTANGFKNMLDISIGDILYDEKGKPCSVIKSTDIMYGRDCYEVVFDDDSIIVADSEHLWRVQTHLQRKNIARRVPEDKIKKRLPKKYADYSIVSTIEMKNNALSYNNHCNYSIVLAQPICYAEKNLPIPSYTLGAWLGDGSSSAAVIHCVDDEIIKNIVDEDINISSIHIHSNQGKAKTYFIGSCKKKDRKRDDRGRYITENSLYTKLKKLGLLNNKHIPEIYKTGSVEQRLALLQGLMDTDGYCAQNGEAEFTTTNAILCDDVLELMRSLGLKPRKKNKRAQYYGKDCGVVYRVFLSTAMPIFRLERKLERLVGGYRKDIFNRYIREIKKVDSVPVKCIQVDSKSGLYLAGKEYIVTHNTNFGPRWLAKKILQYGSGDYYAITASYDLFKLKMLPSFLELFEHVLDLGRFWSGDKIFELRNPKTGDYMAKKSTDPMWARVILRSASAPGGLESGTGRAAWLDEAGQPEFTLLAWRAIQRRLALYNGDVLITTTLYNLGWLKHEIIDVAKKNAKTKLNKTDRGEIRRTVDKKQNIDLIQFDSTINPAFPLAEFEAAKARMPDDEFSMFYRGLETKLRSMIYDVFESKHIIEPFSIPRNYISVVGIDPMGERVAALWFTIDTETYKVYVTQEYYEPFGITTEGHVQNILYMSQGYNVICYVGGGPSERQARVDWAAAGIALQEPPFSDIWSQIQRAYALFKMDNLSVFNTCSNFLDEIGTYQRKMDKTTNILLETIEKDEQYHLMSCLRYACSWMTEPRDSVNVEYNPVQIGNY